MKIVICGTRGYHSEKHYNALRDVLMELWPIDVILHGDCPNSADKLAERYGQEHDIEVIAYPADWKNGPHSKSGTNLAGFVRNLRMAEENPDYVVAIWDGKSN